MTAPRPPLADLLDLAPHPEGGWFRETWRSELELAALPGYPVPQLLVPPGVWQSARPTGDAEVLVSCVVVPGFDFTDFRMFRPGPTAG